MRRNGLISRRSFAGKLAVATAGLACTSGGVLAAAPAAGKDTRFKIVGFTKPFQKYSFEETADVVAEVGWTGIECPVRKGGQIEPERVAEDLPRMFEALKKRNLEISIITTDIRSTTTPFAEKILRTAAGLGIGRYRLSYWKYTKDKSIPAQLEAIGKDLRGLAALNRETGLCGCIQNHSGNDYFGAPIWDAYEVIKGMDPKQIGFFFDIGHATLEGGYSWPIQARLIEPFLNAVYVKDFRWEKKGNAGRADWCPLGDGMVSSAYFQTLKQSAFRGLISAHQEYELGSRKEMIAFMKKDLEVLKRWLGEV